MLVRMHVLSQPQKFSHVHLPAVESCVGQHFMVRLQYIVSQVQYSIVVLIFSVATPKSRVHTTLW